MALKHYNWFDFIIHIHPNLQIQGLYLQAKDKSIPPHKSKRRLWNSLHIQTLVYRQLSPSLVTFLQYSPPFVSDSFNFDKSQVPNSETCSICLLSTLASHTNPPSPFNMLSPYSYLHSSSKSFISIIQNAKQSPSDPLPIHHIIPRHLYAKRQGNVRSLSFSENFIPILLILGFSYFITPSMYTLESQKDMTLSCSPSISHSITLQNLFTSGPT